MLIILIDWEFNTPGHKKGLINYVKQYFPDTLIDRPVLTARDGKGPPQFSFRLLCNTFSDPPLEKIVDSIWAAELGAMW